MRVFGPQGTAAPSSIKRKSKPGSSGEAFSVAPQEEKSAAPITGAGPLAALDSLLALQGVGTPTDSPSRGLKRAHDLLDLLDGVQIGLLTGRLPKAKLTQLVNALARARETVSDIRLQSVLDEVELRAAVELAKLQQEGVA